MTGMTVQEFMDKCDWEGGIEEAIFGYGLTEEDLAVQEGEFYEAVKELRTLRPKVNELTQTLYRLSEDAVD